MYENVSFLGGFSGTIWGMLSCVRKKDETTPGEKHMWCQRMCQSAIMSQKYISFSKASHRQDGSGYTTISVTIGANFVHKSYKKTEKNKDEEGKFLSSLIMFFLFSFS